MPSEVQNTTDTAAVIASLTEEQRKFLTLRTHKSVSISGPGWDGLVRAGLIEDDISRLKLTAAGQRVSDRLSGVGGFHAR